MSDSLPRETEVQAVLLQELECYRLSVQAAQRLAAAAERGEAGEVEMREVTELLHKVATLERGLKEVRKAYTKTAGGPGTEVKAVTEQIAGTIQTLRRILGDAEAVLARNRDRLAPVCDAIIRARRMQQAYRRKIR